MKLKEIIENFKNGTLIYDPIIATSSNHVIDNHESFVLEHFNEVYVKFISKRKVYFIHLNDDKNSDYDVEYEYYLNYLDNIIDNKQKELKKLLLVRENIIGEKNG